MSKWKDSRIETPSPNQFSIYDAVFLVSPGHTMTGRAAWSPRESYTTGVWEECYASTGNPLGKLEVLYWLPHPKGPELV